MNSSAMMHDRGIRLKPIKTPSGECSDNIAAPINDITRDPHPKDDNSGFHHEISEPKALLIVDLKYRDKIPQHLSPHAQPHDYQDHNSRWDFSTLPFPSDN